MSLLLHPHDILKRFAIASESGGIGSDTTYFLVFTTNGRMVVRVEKDYDQQYKTPDVHEFEPKDFGSVTVNGKLLVEVVLEKLRTVFIDPCS